MASIECIHCKERFEPIFAKEVGATTQNAPEAEHQGHTRLNIRVLCPWCKQEMIGYHLWYMHQSVALDHAHKINVRAAADELPPMHYTTY